MTVDPARLGSLIHDLEDDVQSQPTNVPVSGVPLYPGEVPRLFALFRDEDPTGLSGVGLVAWGVQFWDGMAVTRWRGTTTGISQVSMWESVDQVLKIHGHDGKSRVVFVDDPAGTLLLGALLLSGGGDIDGGLR